MHKGSESLAVWNQICRCTAAINLAEFTVDDLHMREMLVVNTANNDSSG